MITTTGPSTALLVLELKLGPPAAYSLETVAQICCIHPALVLHYCRIGLLGPRLARENHQPIFDDTTLFELRRVEHYRREHRIERRTVRLLCSLWREVDRIEGELRTLRDQPR